MNIISTLGEFFEREILINNNQINSSYFNSISLLNGEIRKVPVDRVVFKRQFVDSCGMASHTESNQLVKSAFMEFYERQCFILNYLSSSKGIKLNIKNLDNLKEKERYLKNFVDGIVYYNISIDKDISVVLSIATGDKHNAVGLGTHYSIFEAIKKSQNELLQYFTTSLSKHNNSELGLPNSGIIKKDLYHSYFDGLTSPDLKECYSYLQPSPEILVEKNWELRNNDIRSIVKRLNKRYGIEPFIVTIPSKRSVPHLKISKVFDYNWIPHMYPSLYTNSVFEYVQSRTKLQLNRNVKYLPFP